MNIIIIGNGYIGQPLVNFLEKKHTVDTVDRKDATFNCDYKELPKEFYEKYDCVILTAGYSDFISCKNLAESLENNVMNFVNLLDKIRTKKFIYASSGVVYGTSASKGVISKESDSLGPSKTNYEITKKTIDEISLLSEMDFYGLRLGSVFGPSKYFRTDLIINKCLSNMLKKQETILYEENINRPFAYTGYVNQAIDAILESPPHPGIYNISNTNLTIGGLANLLKKLFPDIQIKFEKKDCYDFSMSTDKFSEIFNVQLKKDISSVIQNTWDFLQSEANEKNINDSSAYCQ